MNKRKDVCLVNMPFAAVERPSIGLGILKSALKKSNLDASIIYANLLFAEKVDFITYNRVMRFPTVVTEVHDWCFAHTAFPDFNFDDEQYLDFVLSRLATFSAVIFACPISKIDKAAIKSELFHVRRHAKEFIEDLAAMILLQKPKIVGCSSVFSQQTASLALLRKIKDLSSDTITMLGGANCCGEMGMTIAKKFPWVDMVFSGEADDSFCSLCEELISFGPSIKVENLPDGAINKNRVLYVADQLGNDYGASELHGIAKDLDNVPIPDYDEYFETLSRMPYKKYIEATILLEGSRGCWWNRCTFCGLNQHGKCFRKKHYKKIFDEIVCVSNKYNVYDIEFVDNILPMESYNDLLPLLTQLPDKYNIFFESKANLSKQQIQKLVNAKIKWIQPGIENLHDGMLDLMDKGTSAVINLGILKYGVEAGLGMSWSILVGFPGENKAWLEQMAKDLQLFHHLIPPSSLIPVIFQRFSEYHKNSEKYNLQLEPFFAFKFLYPFQSINELSGLAYHFQDQNYGMQSDNYDDKYRFLRHEMFLWQHEFFKKNPAELLMMDDGNSIKIHDSRYCAVANDHIFIDVCADILRVTEAALNIKSISKRIQSLCGKQYTQNRIDDAIMELKNKKILYEHNGNVISLAVKDRKSIGKCPLGNITLQPDFSVYLKETDVVHQQEERYE